MTFSGHNPDLFRWRSQGKTKTPDDKRVEMASEFAASQVFSQKKPHPGTHNLSMPLHSSDQLRDHDDAYSEAQALLGDWLGSKLRLELEMEEEDDLLNPAGRRSPAALACAEPAILKCDNFNDLYNCLAEEEEQSAVCSFLHDLMEQEVLDSGVVEELALDVGQTRKKFRDPIVTMEARHLQVQENRARRDAVRQRIQSEREAQWRAREEAKRREREEEMRKRQEARRQEDMVQREMVRLRREMEERRGLEQRVRQREKERVEGQRAAKKLQPTPPLPPKEQQQGTAQTYKQEKTEASIHVHNLKFLQRHFSGWYSVVLERRLRLGKATALCDWRKQLRAWRAWQAVVWARRRQREVARTEEELRAENRRCQLAAESDRRRLLRRCLNEWQLWCRTEKEQRALLAQQQETRRKMAALINAASAGKLEAPEPSKYQKIMAPPEAVSTQPKRTNKEDHDRPCTLAANTAAVRQKTTPVGDVTQPIQPWQVTRHHTVPTSAELCSVRQRRKNDAVSGSSTTTVQQQIITQQRQLLKEQQEQIARLKEERSMVSLELEMEKSAQLTKLSVLRGQRAKTQQTDLAEQRAQTVPAEAASLCAPHKEAASWQKCPHPIISAMEERARQRAERRKEIEELKKKREEEKLAEMQAAEEQRKREEEEEKRKAAERRREEKRQEKERQEEKQRQLTRQQELLKLARHHYNKNLLLRRGLAPWKRLIQLRQANMQLADSHHNLSLLSRCIQGWLQSAKESLSEKEASADQLYQHFLLQRSLSCWKRLKDWRLIQAERAERFYRTNTLRRFLLALLDHVTQERLLEWDRQELSQEHNNRRVLRRCFMAWRQFPSLQRKEKEKEVRRERLGRKVAEVLHDFCSNPL
ncbi:coiled-coil domain-containing protein 191 isoform X2 [Halichoeres trimaculatus]|uniref:coiled-coil domain-containing protein 191 isoform X2 n=1 Tax=Halichoeres trimaculatus TaxID=147232 RepID=UPI003D9DE84B